jgi:hypothetical protein
MPYTYATLLYARAVALAVLGRVEEAIEEEKLFLVAFEHKEMGSFYSFSFLHITFGNGGRKDRGVINVDKLNMSP